MSAAHDAVGRVIVFDLGGVVVRICRSWEEACAEAGVEVRAMDRFRQPELSARRKELHHLHQIGAIECDKLWPALADSTGGLYTADEVRKIHNAWTLDDYPGMSALVDELHSTGYSTACLSNTNRAHWSILCEGDGSRRAASAGLRGLGLKMASHELRAAKPDATIYQLAEAKLGVEPARIVFFDDLEENVAAARARGWSAWRIDHTGDPALQIRAALGLVTR